MTNSRFVAFWFFVLLANIAFTVSAAHADGGAVGAEIRAAENDPSLALEDSESDVLSEVASEPATTSLKASSKSYDSESRFSLMPMAGATAFSGRWYDHIGNQLTYGLAMQWELSQIFALELSGQTGSYEISYQGVAPGTAFTHDFRQTAIGANMKAYLSKSKVQPYVGAGLSGIHYQGMKYGPHHLNAADSYSKLIGAGQLVAGAELALSDSIAIGARGEYVVPLLGKMDERARLDNPTLAAPGYEESAAINSAFYRILGTARVSF